MFKTIVCNTCDIAKAFTEFHQNKPSLNGRLKICKTCHSLKYKASELKSFHKRFFGGNREAVLKRDRYRCVNCRMDDKEHRKKFGRSISIDHINGLGCNSKIKDNRMCNLQTLCLPCHGKKDILNRSVRPVLQ